MGWTTGVQFSGQDISFCHNVQTRSGAYPASYPMHTRVLSSYMKKPGHSHIMQSLRMHGDIQGVPKGILQFKNAIEHVVYKLH
jgi:hypothetical protein